MKNVLLTAALVLSAAISQARENEVFWKSQNVSIGINSSEAQTFQKALQLEQYVRVYTVRDCSEYVDPVYVVRAGTCYDVQCQGGAGKSEAWNAFYSAKKEDKAARLAAAVKGIGQKTAEKLVAAGAFSSKPRSWNDFKAAINQAVASGVIDDQIKNLVLSTYRNENMNNLGYNSSSCTSTPYACTESVLVTDGYVIPKTCEDYSDTLVQAKAVNYIFNVSGAVLLPTESDSLTASVSAPGSMISLGSAEHNTYQAQLAEGSTENQMIFNIQGVARKQVDLPSSALARVDLFPKDKVTASLQISVSPLALPQAGTEELVATYEIRSCQPSFIGCVTGWDKKETKSVKITEAVTALDIPAGLAPGKRGLKVQVEVSISKRNSIYHSARSISKESEKVTLK